MSTKGKLRAQRFILAGCLVVLLSGCSLLPKEEVLEPPLVKPVQQSFMTAEAKLGTITKTIIHDASFVSKKQQQLSFGQAGSRLKSLDVKLGDPVKKGQIIARLDPGNLEDDIYTQKIMLEKAVLIYQQAVQSSASDAVDRRLKQMDVEAAQSNLQQSQAKLDATFLVSQMDGIVTYLADMKEGDIISAFTTVATISDPKQVQLEAEFSYAVDLSPIEVSTKVEVDMYTADTGEKIFQGHVIQTPKTAPQTTDKDQQKHDASTLVIGVDDLPAGVTIGTGVTIKIITAQKTNALIIPKSAVRGFMGMNTVHILDGELRKEVNVQVGIENDSEAEITQGLQPGQIVILNE